MVNVIRKKKIGQYLISIIDKESSWDHNILMVRNRINKRLLIWYDYESRSSAIRAYNKLTTGKKVRNYIKTRTEYW